MDVMVRPQRLHNAARLRGIVAQQKQIHRAVEVLDVSWLFFKKTLNEPWPSTETYAEGHRDALFKGRQLKFFILYL